MCATAKSVAEDESWEDAFDSEREARDKKKKIDPPSTN
jgi:hypothetical protein